VPVQEPGKAYYILHIINGVNMAHLKNVLTDTEHIPSFLSSHKAILKAFGGPVDSTYDASFDKDEGRTSRHARHTCRKDFRINGSRNYRTWQFTSINTIKGGIT